jgi:hypothetical protein
MHSSHSTAVCDGRHKFAECATVARLSRTLTGLVAAPLGAAAFQPFRKKERSGCSLRGRLN